MRTFKDIPYLSEPHERAYLDIYLPEGEVKGVLIYFHGGGIYAGGKYLYKGLIPLVENDGIALVMPNYRLYPNAKFPEYLYDAAAACAWTKEHISEYADVNTDNLYISGSSAGGYISMMLYFDQKYLSAYGAAVNDFRGYVFDAGQPTTHFSVLKYDYKVDHRKIVVDEAAPIYHIDNYDGRPPVLILASDHDMHCRLSQTHVLIDTMTYFSYPEDKINFKLMENTTHCSYVNEPIFAEEINTFFEKTKK